MQILEALKAGERITPLNALRRFGCFRLATRIFEMKRAGYEIECSRISENGKSYGCYSMRKKGAKHGKK